MLKCEKTTTTKQQQQQQKKQQPYLHVCFLPRLSLKYHDLLSYLVIYKSDLRGNDTLSSEATLS